MAISGRRATVGAGWPRVVVDRDRLIASFDPDSPPSRSVATRRRIVADLVYMVTTWSEAFDYALDALLGIGRSDQLTDGVIDSENARHCRVSLGRCDVSPIEGKPFTGLDPQTFSSVPTAATPGRRLSGRSSRSVDRRSQLRPFRGIAGWHPFTAACRSVGQLCRLERYRFRF